MILCRARLVVGTQYVQDEHQKANVTNLYGAHLFMSVCLHL